MQDKLIEILNEGLEKRADKRGEDVAFHAEKESDGVIAFVGRSDAGEELIFSADCSGGVGPFIEEVQNLYEYFNIEEHVHMWLDAKAQGVANVPDVATLVDDARSIDEMLETLADDIADMSAHELKDYVMNYSPARLEGLIDSAANEIGEAKQTEAKEKDFDR